MRNKSFARIGLIMTLLAVLALAVTAVSAQDEEPGNGPSGRPGRGMDERGLLIEIVAEETGLTPAEVLAQVREGNTLADVITANGGSVDAVVEAAVTAMTENLSTRVTDLLDREWNVRDFTPGPDRAPVRNLLSAVSEATGLDASEIRDQVQAGSSLADILAASNVDVAAFVDGLLADAQTRLADAVESGRITQEEADTRLENLSTRITDFINRTVEPASTDS
jgi:hypothetical protein